MLHLLCLRVGHHMDPAANSSPQKGRTSNASHSNSTLVPDLLISIKSRIEDLKEYLLLKPNNEGVTVEKLQRIVEDLSRQNAIQKRMLTIISHDVRAPLNSLKSLMGLAAHGSIKQRELQEVLSGLNQQVEQLSYFLDNILRWIKNQSREIKPDFKRLFIHPILTETIKLLKFQASEKHIAIYDNTSPDIEVFADQEMIKIVLRNLITNAIKFCHANDCIHIWTMERDGKILISVHDTGRGMSPEVMATLFELSHLSNKGTMNELGTGLGLTLCKEFVEKMGGKITVTSTVGEGSCFEFSVHSPTSPTSEFQRFIESH
jgi:two-component system sensor histidine kinase/response regulator